MNKEITIDSVDKVLTKSLEAPSLDPVILSVANEYIEGKTVPQIAENFDVPADIVSSIIDKKEVKAYIDNVYMSQGYMNRFKRMTVINDAINNKIEDAMETGIYGKKDLLDWIKLMNDMESTAKPKDNKPTVAVQVNNNYTDLMERIFKEK